MIQLILGHKGSGKTKTLIAMTNEAVGSSGGQVVCLEKGQSLTYDISHDVRLIDVEEYGITGFDTLYGFLSGLLAGNYDITHVFCDATLKIGGGEKDLHGLGRLISRLEKLPSQDVVLTFTVSCEPEELPENVQKYMVK